MKTVQSIAVLVALLLCIGSLPTEAKKYPYQFTTDYTVQQIRVAKDGKKFVKVWGLGKNADRAMDKARQNAVAACIFVGVAATDIAGVVPPLCVGGQQDYEAHRAYFDQFFVTGDFLNYVVDTNSRYPTGQDNVGTPDGRRVGIYVEVKYDELRRKLEQDGIIKSLDSYF